MNNYDILLEFEPYDRYGEKYRYNKFRRIETISVHVNVCIDYLKVRNIILEEINNYNL